MNDTSWLMYASIAVWLVLGGYLALLGRKTAFLAARLRRLEYTAENAARTSREPERGE